MPVAPLALMLLPVAVDTIAQGRRDASRVGRIIDRIRSDPRVEHVIDALHVGLHGEPPYPPAAGN
jgi:hypothetical protein